MHLSQRAAFLVLSGLCMATAKAAPPTYNPVGVQQNVPVQTVTGGGWTECYKETFDKDGKSIADISSACSGTQLMMACRPTGDTSLQLLAQAPKVDVMTDTGEGDSATTHQANGVEWYFSSSWSWGFAQAGQVVKKYSCDVENSSGPGSETRMCVHTGNSSLATGYRCGATTLNESATYERIFYTNATATVAKPVAVPATEKWSLLILSLMFAAFAWRRRGQ